MNIKQIAIIAIATAAIIGLVGAAIPAVALECSVLPDSICGAAEETSLEGSGMWRILVWIINTLTVGVGVAAVGAIAFAGFLYATARDDTNQTKKAITMITNTAIGILVYIFMWAILQYLIPGGVLGGGQGSATTPGTATPGGGGPMRVTD